MIDKQAVREAWRKYRQSETLSDAELQTLVNAISDYVELMRAFGEGGPGIAGWDRHQETLTRYLRNRASRAQEKPPE